MAGHCGGGMSGHRLITIPISHYCEKARWALDRAGIAYREEAHFQGFHYLATFRLARTRYVPILVVPGTVLTDSTQILEWLNANAPDDTRRLYPIDPAEKARAVAWEEYFDEVFGPAGRLFMYANTLGSWISRCATAGREFRSGSRGSSHSSFRWFRRLIVRRLKIDAASIESSVQRVEEAFEKVGRELEDGRRFLVGDRFGAAISPSRPSPPPCSFPKTTACRCRRWTSCPARSPSACAPGGSPRPGVMRWGFIGVNGTPVPNGHRRAAHSLTDSREAGCCRSRATCRDACAWSC